MIAKCKSCDRVYKFVMSRGERLANFVCDCGHHGLSKLSHAEWRGDGKSYAAASHQWGRVYTPEK